MEEEATACIARQCVTPYRPRHGKDGELELRLGSYVDGHFVAGIRQETFLQLERDMGSDPNLIGDEQWTDVLDYFYPHTNGQTVRTRVSYDADEVRTRTCHVFKETVTDAILVPRADGDEERQHVAGRIACATETSVLDPPHSCLLNYVRVKQMKRFQDVRQGEAVWTYVLARTWSATTRDEVEERQQKTQPIYEAECELSDARGTYLAAHDDAHVAQSMIFKMRRLLGLKDDAALTLVQRPSTKGKGRASSSVSAGKRRRGRG